MLLLDAYREADSVLHRRDARAKMLVCFALIAGVSAVTPSHAERLALYAALLTAMLVLGRLSPVWVVRRSLVVLPFVALPLLSLLVARPAGSHDTPWALAFTIAARSLLAAAALVVLMASTTYTDLLDGAARLGAPQMLVTLASFFYRYLLVLTDEGGRMVLARELRGGGRGGIQRGAQVAGRMVAALFLRTYDRAERIHQCMVARGFEGQTRRVAPRAMRPADWAFTLVFAMAALATALQ